LIYPKISVVVPSYNQGKYIEETILSILNQEYPNLELIIFDGGSTDETHEILAKYRSSISYLSIGKDSGQADALKKGFDIATGDIFCWLNSDDIFNENTFSRISRLYQSNSRMSAYYGNLDVINDKGKYIFTKYLTPLPILIGNKSVCNGVFGFYQPSFLFTSDAYRLTTGINPDLFHCMDNDLFKKLAELNVDFIYQDYSFSSFRIHEMSKTVNYSNIARKEQKQLFKSNMFLIHILNFFARIYRLSYYIYKNRLFDVIKSKRSMPWLP
tara:strand:- start:1450 stop:2259 length:810 start_codon:yes stop_codon:yes gene_type:complete